MPMPISMRTERLKKAAELKLKVIQQQRQLFRIARTAQIINLPCIYFETEAFLRGRPHMPVYSTPRYEKEGKLA
jgi:hypothetical protein